ncbi:antitoxin Xre/MbcA/ParS toxin-binding domain-containing protein [Oxalobacteraceae bacterium A2-2]
MTKPAITGPHPGFSSLLDALRTGSDTAAAGIRQGYPATLLKDASRHFGVPANRIRGMLRLPETTAHTLLKRGGRLDAPASERLWRLADLTLLAVDVFEDEEAAKAWLRTASPVFDGQAPMDVLDTEPGGMAVRQVLNAIATGGGA